jgi:hypothetical protein
MFTFSPSTDPIGITGMGELEVPPASIIRRFGQPAEGDGYKLSGEFVFVDGAGEPFVIHDWKSTRTRPFRRPKSFGPARSRRN